jgi:hypothetical protein
MYCTRCNGQIQAEDCNLSTLVARCRHCQHVFRFADQLDPAVQEPSRRVRAERPPNFKVEDQAYGFGRRIWWVWAEGYDKAFAIFIANLGTVMLWSLWFDQMFPLSSYPWSFFVFLGVATAGSVFANYYALASLLNRTTVEVDGGQLAVRHGPIPWPGNRAFEMADVDEVVFDDDSEWRRGTLVHRFHVTVIDREGGRHRLFETQTPQGAQFIAEQLQEWLAAGPLPAPAPKKSISRPSDAIHRSQ